MIELKSFPMRDQLRDVRSKDGKPAENASYDCVPTSLAACIQYYTGKVVAADDLKDATYGQGHIGGGDAMRYVPVLKQYGLTIRKEPLPSASQAIIDRVRFWMRQGVPCIVTMHSHWSTPWMQDGGDGLHVGVPFSIAETDAGLLHIMNPWRGFDHVQPVAWWRARLGNGVWPVQKIAQPVPAPVPAVQPQVVTVAGDWHDDGTTLTAPNGHAVIGGFREFVLERLRAYAWQGGLPQSEEWKMAAGMAVQPFDATTLLWNPGDKAPRYANVTELSAIVRQLHQAA